MAEDEIWRDDLYSDRQEKVLAILPMITAPFSIIGSLIIIFLITRDYKNKLKRVYHRIMLSMSVMDVISSVNLTFGAGWLIPKGTDGVFHAVGMTGTCEVNGFLLQLGGLLVALYNASLALYFLLFVRYKCAEKFIARRVEPFIHGFSLLIPLATAAVGLLTNTFNPLNTIPGWCWYMEYPANCSLFTDVPCIRGANYKIVSRLCAEMFLYVILLIIIVSMVSLYLKVRANNIRMMERYNQHGMRSMKQTRQTGIQALLYIGAFFLTYISLLVLQLSGRPDTAENRTYYFALAVTNKIFMPLQGFWNAFIFLRPRIQSWQRSSSMGSARRLFFERISSTISLSGHNTNNVRRRRGSGTTPHQSSRHENQEQVRDDYLSPDDAESDADEKAEEQNNMMPPSCLVSTHDKESSSHHDNHSASQELDGEERDKDTSQDKAETGDLDVASISGIPSFDHGERRIEERHDEPGPLEQESATDSPVDENLP